MQNQVSKSKVLSWKTITVLITSLVLFVLAGPITRLFCLSIALNFSLSAAQLNLILSLEVPLRLMTYGVFGCLFVYTLVSHRKINGKGLMKPLLVASACLIIVFMFSSMLTAPLVKAETTAVTGYYLARPIPGADWYLGKLSDGTYYAINGSNWNDLTAVEPWQSSPAWASYASNYTALTQQALASITYGEVYLKEIPFNYNLTIPANVQVVDNTNGVTRIFINSASSQGSPYTISVDNVNTGYYLAQDSASRIINTWSSTNAYTTISNALALGPIFVKDGTYPIGTQISTPFSVTGNSWNTFFLATASINAVFAVTGNNVQIQDLTINCASQATYAVENKAVSNSLVYNVQMINPTGACVSYYWYPNSGSVEWCSMSGFGAYGILCTSTYATITPMQSGPFYFEHNNITGNFGTTDGIFYHSEHNIYIGYNTISGCFRGTDSIIFGGTCHVTNINIYYNRIFNNTEDDTLTMANGGVIANNNLGNCSNNNIDGTYNDLSITGNTLTDSNYADSFGIAGGISLETASSNNTITGNTISKTTQGTYSHGISIQTGADNNTISDNTFANLAFGVVVDSTAGTHNVIPSTNNFVSCGVSTVISGATIIKNMVTETQTLSITPATVSTNSASFTPDYTGRLAFNISAYSNIVSVKFQTVAQDNSGNIASGSIQLYTNALGSIAILNATGVTAYSQTIFTSADISANFPAGMQNYYVNVKGDGTHAFVFYDVEIIVTYLLPVTLNQISG